MNVKTKVVHAGFTKDPTTGAIMPPIYMTSTYVQSAPGETLGYEYTRAGNPNFTILEELIASLEKGRFATVFSSGLGALTALLADLNPGDRISTLGGVYGGTYRALTHVFSRYGIDYQGFKINELEKALSRKPKYLLFETPTNPLLEIIDISQAVLAAKNEGALVVVDNTFATPVFQTPLDFGADVVWHSTTKYMGGHSDTIGGALVVNDPELKKRIDFNRMAIGLNPSPFDVWLTTRGIKTLALRMEQHAKNALLFARFLHQHLKVKKVYYPGLESHEGHAIATKQMSGFSGIVSAEFHLSLEQVKQLISSFKLFALAESLGGVESLVNHPVSMTHASIPKNVREEMGITDGLVRFSVGIEEGQDLVDDVKTALQN